MTNIRFGRCGGKKKRKIRLLIKNFSTKWRVLIFSTAIGFGIWSMRWRCSNRWPKPKPKNFFWIGFGFGQLTKKRCYRFLGNPKCCQPPIYCDVGWQNHYKKSKIFLLDYFYKWNIMIPIWELVSFSRNLSDAAVLLSSNYTPVCIYNTIES